MGIVGYAESVCAAITNALGFTHTAPHAGGERPAMAADASGYTLTDVVGLHDAGPQAAAPHIEYIPSMANLRDAEYPTDLRWPPQPIPPPPKTESTAGNASKESKDSPTLVERVSGK